MPLSSFFSSWAAFRGREDQHSHYQDCKCGLFPSHFPSRMQDNCFYSVATAYPEARNLLHRLLAFVVPVALERKMC
jgi:hypothetical protein